MRVIVIRMGAPLVLTTTIESRFTYLGRAPVKTKFQQSRLGIGSCSNAKRILFSLVRIPSRSPSTWARGE